MQASAQAVETRNVSTAGAAPVPGAPGEPSEAGRRVTARTIELIGLALGVAFITAVALGHELSNDELWSLAAGQWMLTHHRIMGLDPFSYTEAHRRWVADEWGSEVALAGLFRAFGAWAYNLYAIVLGALSLVAARLYVRGAGCSGWPGGLDPPPARRGPGRGGGGGPRPRLLARLVAARALPAGARRGQDPRWLLGLPLLCVLWVNTHGSILVGLGVLVVELAWSFAPERWAARIGGYGRSPYAGRVALALVGSLVASCITPYGPGLLSYDIGVSTNGQIGQYIDEWNSPDFHSLAVVLVFLIPLVVVAVCIYNHRFPVLEGTLAAVLFVEALRTQRLVIYLMVVAAGLAATLPVRPWDPVMRKLAGAAFVMVGILCLAAPSVPAGTAVALPADAGLRLPEHAPRTHLHGVHVGRLLHRPPPGHLRRRAHRPLRGERPDRVLRHHRHDDEPRPRAVGLPRVLRGVGTRHGVVRVPATTTRAGTWWTGHRWRWCSPAARAAPPGGSRAASLEPAQVAVVVGPGGDRPVAERIEVGAQQLGLVPAELDQQRPARSQEGRGLVQNPAQERGAVGSAVVVGGVLEAQVSRGRRPRAGVGT